ncbi:hypothetical protein Poli38472_001560 [Pythium oligandrum]|uniref:Palmitoyltransferase n=1 Tax=Pythium oligandrum TaxID=41045 RepID=A0A8K1FQG7_PYTOL|nr:hypothetical protein Poli38472_001560 [Pythium oligandrum]|eukprot:TMW69404.1 hypothetical protein Poli38472_001560 [Pythium oligandrum]
MRVNGFQAPFSRDQVTSWVLQPLMMSCFIAFVAKLLDRDKCLAILIPNAVLIIIILSSWYICEHRDPSQERSKDGCSVLSLPKKMTRYCTLCCKTSPGLDHHCTWLNTCIAENNYEAFYTLVVAATLQTLLQAVIGILMATIWFSEIKTQLTTSWHTPVLVLLWVHNAITLPLANSYFLLAGFHTYLLVIRSGTYDFILENGSDGICVRMLKCRCLMRSKKNKRKQSQVVHAQQKRRSISKTTPVETTTKVIVPPASQATSGFTQVTQNAKSAADKQREIDQWKAEWLSKYGGDDDDDSQPQKSTGAPVSRVESIQIQTDGQDTATEPQEVPENPNPPPSPLSQRTEL